MKVNFRFWIAVGLSATVGLFVGEHVMARGIKTHTVQVKDSGNNQEWQNVGLTNEECHDAILFLLKQYESELEAL